MQLLVCKKFSCQWLSRNMAPQCTVQVDNALTHTHSHHPSELSLGVTLWNAARSSVSAVRDLAGQAAAQWYNEQGIFNMVAENKHWLIILNVLVLFYCDHWPFMPKNPFVPLSPTSPFSPLTSIIMLGMSFGGSPGGPWSPRSPKG